MAGVAADGARSRCSSGGRSCACAASASANAIRRQIPAATLTRIDVCWSAAKGLILSDLIRGLDFQARHAAAGPEGGRAVPRGARSRDRSREFGPGRRALARSNGSVARGGHGHREANRSSACDRIRPVRGRGDRLPRRALEGCPGPHRARGLGASRAVPRSGLGPRQHALLLLLVLFYLGELKQLEEALPGLLKEAEDRGDLYAVTSMRTRLSYLVRLANDEPERAREELAKRSRFGRRRVPPSALVRNDGQVEMPPLRRYGAGAWRLVGDRWPAAASAPSCCGRSPS